MHRRTRRGNRVGLALTGIVLALAGAALFAAHQGYYGSAGEHDVLYPPSAQRFVHQHGSWLWPVVAAVAVILGLVFLRWLLVQPRTDRLRGLVIDTDEDTDANPAAGRTRMPAHAVTDIVEDDVVGLHGVRRVSAALSGHTDSPELWLDVTTDSDADLARIRDAVTSSVLPAARDCLDRPDLPTYLRIAVTKRQGSRALR